MPILDVGDRLASPIGRLDLARELFGVMFHPHNREARRQRQSAFGVTLLGMSDADDERDARELAKTWFKKAGGFKTDAQADRYHKQQDRALEELLLRVFPTGLILHLIWAMNVHHREELIRGPSVHKAIAIMRGASCSPFEGVSKRTLQSAWSRYKSVAHICAVFALIFYSSDVDLAQKEEALKTAVVEELHTTLALVAAYQRFGTSFTPHGSRRPLLDPSQVWLLRGSEADEHFVPSELLPDELAVAKAYRAPKNAAYG
jgi:hypothetical protein